MAYPAAIEMLIEQWHCHRAAALVLLALASTLLFLRFRSRERHDQTQQVSPQLDVSSNKCLTGPEPVHNASDEVTKHPSIIETSQVTAPRKIQGKRPLPKSRLRNAPRQESENIQPVVFFYSLGGTTAAHAKDFANDLNETIPALNKPDSTHKVLSSQLQDLSVVDYDDYFTSLPKASGAVRFFYFIIVPTYNIDTSLDVFLCHLKDVHHDFRIDTAPLRSLLGYSVFGFGDRQEWPTEPEGYCSHAVLIDRWMARLTSGRRAYPLGMGDVSGDGLVALGKWKAGIDQILVGLAAGAGLGEGVPGSGDAVESDEDDDEVVEKNSRTSRPPTETRTKNLDTTTLGDVENLGTVFHDETDFTTSLPPISRRVPPPKEMVPAASTTYKALTKQGYSIIGSHSGVKLCRWTKSALRGRGSCYKHSFYGIASHLCMETTPSLSCSNKCVFCWRHGTNPVGTSWRWQVDDPTLIFDGATAAHYQKIRVLRGVPGVRADRFEDAMRIRHCALSLVGEPIFYPHINEFVSLLHNQRISSFLVCNAQHPTQLADLTRVTQLYVSIDAADRDTLRRIDRPLHRDFWERFCACLDILRETRFRQRTVFRLTLVKGFNIEEEADGYASLVERALPCFVEIKGVTFCGTSTSAGAGLTMQNVPFYEEVVAFVEALNAALEKRGLAYGIAAEHAHSCCVLLASKRFWRPVDSSVDQVKGQKTMDVSASSQSDELTQARQMAWHTSISYKRFFELLESGEDFKPEDYCESTVEWALWGNGGFDPTDERVGKKGKGVGRTKPAIG